jgi:heptosyltransferase-2
LPLDAAPLGRILVRLPNWLGDVVMAAPAVAALHRAAPGADLVAACRAPFAPLAALLPGVVETVPLGPVRGVKAPFRAARALRDARCEAAVVFPRSTRAAIPVVLARIPVRVGFASEVRSLFLTHPVRGWRDLRRAHRSAYYASLLGPFGIAPAAGAAPEPWRLDVPPAALAWADDFLASSPARRAGRPLVALEPGATYGPAKRWPEPRFAELAGRLASSGEADVVVIGNAEAEPIEERIAARAGAPVIRAAGKTDLVRLAGLLARSAALVTNDTGPMHVASAVGTPVVALFGATDPNVSAPRGGPLTLLYEPVPCSPCFLRECVVDGHPCLDQFTVERVLRATRPYLPGPKHVGAGA